jgi:hypothetical protein
MIINLYEPWTWRLIDPYLDRALELDPGELESWLACLAHAQPALTRLLRELLAERDALNACGYLEIPIGRRMGLH